MADPLRFGDEDDQLVDLTNELEKAIIDDPLLGGGGGGTATVSQRSTAASQQQQQHAGVHPSTQTDPLSTLGPLGPLGGSSHAAAGGDDTAAAAAQQQQQGFDPFASGEADRHAQEDAQHFDPFATYGALGPPPSYSDAAAAPTAPPAVQQQQLQEQQRREAAAAGGLTDSPLDSFDAGPLSRGAAGAGVGAAGGAGFGSLSGPPSGFGTPEPWDSLPEPPGGLGGAAAKAPLQVEVKDPQKSEGSGMLGMKGECERCVALHWGVALVDVAWCVAECTARPSTTRHSSCGHPITPLSPHPYHPGSYMSYAVASKSSLPGWSPFEVTVRRRFRDFVSLADMVKVRRGRCFIWGARFCFGRVREA